MSIKTYCIHKQRFQLITRNRKVWAAILFLSQPYIDSTTVLSDYNYTLFYQCGRLTVIWYAKRTKHFRMHTKFSQNLLDGMHFCLPALRKHARGVGGVYSHCTCAQRALIYNMAGKTLFDFGITVTRNSYTEGEEPHEGDARSEDEGGCS